MAKTSASRRLAGRLGGLVLFAFALAVAGVVSLACSAIVPGTALAYDPGNDIGAVHEGANTRYCSTYAELNDELAALKNKTVTVDMYRDWGSGIATSRLVIPANTRVTLNMGGHKIDRNLAGSKQWKSDGEVIVVKAGATLTINGGSGSSPYSVSVFQSTDPDPTLGSITVTGALITGGASTNGAGGIHVQTGATVTLNNVTIAGCRSQKGSASRVGSVLCGYGGGMYLCGGDITVNMNNSTITGCYASEDGGGVYADNSKASTINLVNSHIDANCAHSDGGGVNLDGKGSCVKGDASMAENGTVSGSSISNNKCVGRGGGILAWNSGITVDSLALEGNQGGNGGGIYVAQDKAILKDLVIRNNQADKGGGVYFAPGSSDEKNYAGDTTIHNCTITGNSADTSGGGVYCDEHSAANGKRKRTLSGVTVIKENTRTSGTADDNLFIASHEWWAKDESFNLSSGSEVWVSWVDEGSWLRLVPNKDGNCAQCLRSDQPGYCFIYNVEGHRIERVASDSDQIPEIPQAITISAANANNASGEVKVGSNEVAGKIRTIDVGGNDYNLIRGFASHGGIDEISSFYYSDGLFYSDPYTYNEHLATVSLTFAYCGGYMDNFAEEVNGNKYYNKHWGARQFLADIGCPDQNIYVSDSMIVKPGIDSIGVTIGSKELVRADGTKTGDILIPVAVRGFGYEAEWVSNVTIGYASEMGWQKEAKGFSDAATYVYKEIEYYVQKYDLFDAYKAGKVKFWITGYSRAGATANLTGKRLVDAIANDNCDSQVFCYPCEAPKGGTDDAETAGHNYNCIHNLVNKADIVPYVAPGQMGFKRYGVDHYIPGTPAGAVKATVKSVTHGGSDGPGKVTTQADNAPTLTKTDAYNSQRRLMLQQLTALDPDMVFNDHFQPQALDFVSTSGYMHVYDEGDYRDNHIEDFVEDFIWFLVVKSNISRDAYAKNSYKLGGTTYPSIQTAARYLMQIAKSGNGLSGIIDSAGNIKSGIPYVSFLTFWPFGDIGAATPKAIDYSMASLYLNVVGEWGGLSDSDKATWTRSLWNTFVKSGALDKLSADDKDKFESAFPTILNVALTLVDSDYNYKPKNNVNNQWAKGSNETMMYIPTLIEHVPCITQNHDQNLNLAWARSYDSWYQGEKDNFKLEQPENVVVPDGYATVVSEASKLEPGEDKSNNLIGSQRIILENSDIVGEAVYYDLYDVTDGNKELAKNQLYRGGIDLALDKNTTHKSYKIVAYDMSYAKPSQNGSAKTVTYNVNLRDAQHKVIVRDLEPDNAGGSAITGQSVASDGDGKGLMAGSVADGSLQAQGEGTSRERVFTFTEGQQAHVQAGIPSTRYFKSWTVELKNEGSDWSPVGLIADADRKKENVAFTMPEIDTTYMAGYQLRFTATYGEKISAMQANPTAPVKGVNLAETVPVAFSGKTDPARCKAVWSYKDSNGNTVPASGEALPGTVYRATICVKQDREHDIVFDPSTVEVGVETPNVTFAAERNVAEGTVTITFTFNPTEGDPKPPEHKLIFEVGAFDLYANQPISEISETFVSTPGSNVTLVAPDIKDKVFVKWDFSGFEQCELTDDPMSKTITFKLPGGLEGGRIIAQYAPALQKVEVNLYDRDDNLFEPEAGRSVPDHYTMSFLAGGKEYEVNPEKLALTWSPMPEDGKFAPLVAYMASVKAETVDGPAISAREKGSTGEYENIRIIEQPASNVEVQFNNPGQVAMADFARYTVCTTFSGTMYELGAVRQPDSISGIPHTQGATADQVKSLLPKATQILTTSNIVMDADITWDTPTPGDHDEYSAIVWTAHGTVKLPDTVANSDNVSLRVSMTVSVEDAGTALSPTASPDSGTYLYNQVARLTVNEQGGTTYYTTDGSEPTTSSVKYQGEEIHVSRADANKYDEETGYRMFVVKAFTVSEGKRPSNVATFEYVFFDIPIPEGAQLEGNGSEQIGVKGSPFYKLSVVEGDTSSLRIDEDGNAVATKPGVYKVKAHLEDASDCWQLDGRGGRSKEDQVIEFVIAGDQDDMCTVAVKAQPKEGGTVTGGGTYKKGSTVTVTATPNEDYEFVSWMDGSGVASSSRSYSFEVTAGRLLTADFEPILTVCWLNGDGSVLDSATFHYGEKEPSATGKVPVKADDVQYTYTFTSWDDGSWDKLKRVKTYKPQFASKLRKYKVDFVDYDGRVLQSSEMAYGSAPMYVGAIPQRAPTARSTFLFAGWDKKIVPVSGDATYKATYSEAVNRYTVTFVDWNGAVLQSSQLAYGQMPMYAGKTPKRPANVKRTYKFKGWTPEVSNVTGNVTYKAVYSSTRRGGTPLVTMTAKGKAGFVISWTKVKGASGYDVFLSRCNYDGKEIAVKRVKRVKGNKTFSWTKTGLEPKTAYKARVKAYVVVNGKKRYIGSSPLAHAYTSNGTGSRTNAKAVEVNKAKVSIGKGKTFKINATVTKVDEVRGLMPEAHAAKVRYLSTNKKVATITAGGKIKARGAGLCYVYAYAHNGVYKRIKVTVK